MAPSAMPGGGAWRAVRVWRRKAACRLGAVDEAAAALRVGRADLGQQPAAGVGAQRCQRRLAEAETVRGQGRGECGVGGVAHWGLTLRDGRSVTKPACRRMSAT
jgi:hypothetical protein